jgi:hypothetical protein
MRRASPPIKKAFDDAKIEIPVTAPAAAAQSS